MDDESNVEYTLKYGDAGSEHVLTFNAPYATSVEDLAAILKGVADHLLDEKEVDTTV